MANKIPLVVLLVVALIAPAARAQSAGDDKDYNIMAPEKPAPKQKAAPAAKGKKRIGSSSPVYPAPLPPPLHYVPLPSQTVTPLPHVVPPTMYVPQTGIVLPNLPTIAGSGPGGAETSQDRAMRCAHQAGLYGTAQTGDRNAYVGSCINQ